MIVELIPKQVQKPIFGPWFFLITSFLLLLGVATGFFILKHFHAQASESLRNLDQTFQQDIKPEEEMVQLEVSSYRQKVEYMKTVLGRRSDFSRLFDFLERAMHPEVFFVSFRVDAVDPKASLEGIASSFLALEQQRRIWAEQQDLRELNLESIELGSDGAITFGAVLHFDPNFFESQ